MENNKKKKILIIEDDSFVMDIYKTKLTQEGFDVDTADNGMEALKKIEKEKVRPDLMLLDIVMPYVDGLEVLKKVRSISEMKTVPIIMLTNLSQKEEVDEGMALGANDYLIKSHFTPSEVLEKINKYLT
jgi:DNA-binding response OmpR family regulator